MWTARAKAVVNWEGTQLVAKPAPASPRGHGFGGRSMSSERQASMPVDASRFAADVGCWWS
jgi:hypothetical protein